MSMDIIVCMIDVLGMQLYRLRVSICASDDGELLVQCMISPLWMKVMVGIVEYLGLSVPSMI